MRYRNRKAYSLTRSNPIRGTIRNRLIEKAGRVNAAKAFQYTKLARKKRGFGYQKLVSMRR